MYRASLTRSPAVRSFAYQSTRALASKPPPKAPKTSAPPPPPPPGQSQTPPSSEPEPKAPLSSLPSLDFIPKEESSSEGPQERTGARSSKDSLSSIERKRRFLSRVSIAFLLLGAGAATWHLGREWEEDELKEKRLKPEDAPSTRWGRTTLRLSSIFDFFTEPVWQELLPPPLPAPHQKPYTLLVSIDDLLVTSTWDRQHGWRTAKRPGVDYFLGYLSQFYEIVIFTSQYNYTAIPIVEKLDPYQFFITYKLFREACRSVNGTPVKDLSYLNRDLSKVILLDTHPEHASAQPENAVIMPKWEGAPRDRGLVAMIPFLESIAIYKPSDVRPILQAYQGKDIPLEYAKHEAADKQRHIEEWEHHKKGLSTGGFTLSSLFGGSSNVNSSPVPPTYLEQKRREAQLMYKEEQAYINSNKEQFDKMIKAEQEALAQQMPSTFWGAANAMMGGMPPPQPIPQSQPEGGEVKVTVDGAKS
ncbi:HAD-like domain-containing protein [Abortiporus biennis]|nr:HAD-like domain-containing protein [Abortiporus biennis]